MLVTQIVVSAGRVFNHPLEQFSNLRPEVQLTATIGPDEDPVEATKQLQAKAEGLVEDHKQNMIKSIHELYQLSQMQSEMRGLERSLATAQTRLQEIRAKHPQLAETTGNQG